MKVKNRDKQTYNYLKHFSNEELIIKEEYNLWQKAEILNNQLKDSKK